MTAGLRWREVRTRFFILLALTTLAAGMVAGRTSDSLAARLSAVDASEQVNIRLHRIDSEWFSNGGPSALILLAAIFLIAGGPATEPGRGSTLFAAALPVTRRRIIGVQLAVCLGLVAALALSGAIGSIIGGAFVGIAYPVSAALAGAFVQLVSVAPFAAIAMALQVATRRATATLVAIFGAAVAFPPLAADFVPQGRLRDILNRADFPPMISFEPAPGLHTLHGGALFAAIPWNTVALLTLVALLASVTAAALFERHEL